MEKISYEHRIYESVDDESLSYAISRNLTGKKFSSINDVKSYWRIIGPN